MQIEIERVKYQLDALERCLSLADLCKALPSLPKDLGDTCAHILQSIDQHGNGERVAKIIRWLAYSTRSLSLMEIAETITLDIEDDPRLDVERRLEDPQDLRICSSLVTMVRQN